MNSSHQLKWKKSNNYEPYTENSVCSPLLNTFRLHPLHPLQDEEGEDKVGYGERKRKKTKRKKMNRMKNGRERWKRRKLK